MEFDDKSIDSLLKEIVNSEDIELNDIPDIDLYMDQVITLFEMKLKSLKRDDEDKIMTKTMVNNYVKAKILPLVKGKKYNKQQIILLNLIYNLKQNLSLTDIGTLFQPILKEIQEQENNIETVEKMYEVFLDIQKQQKNDFEKEFNSLSALIKEESADIDMEENLKEPTLMVLMLISQANLQKRMAEKIIDKFFKNAESEVSNKSKKEDK